MEIVLVTYHSGERYWMTSQSPRIVDAAMIGYRQDDHVRDVNRFSVVPEAQIIEFPDDLAFLKPQAD